MRMKLAVLYLCFISPCFAEANVMIDGNCRKIKVGKETKPQPCSLVYSHFDNGRTLFQFIWKGSGVAFSGGRDSQLSLREYKLAVDTIIVGLDPADPKRYQAKGVCVIQLADDKGNYVKSATCSATNGLEEAEVVLVGDGRPVKKM